MDSQEWFEKFEVKFLSEPALEVAAVDRLHGQIWIREQWSIARFALLKMALHMLPPLQRKIIRLIFFDNFSERGVAQKLKMERSKVHRVKEEALKRLSKSAFLKLAMYPRRIKSGSANYRGATSKKGTVVNQDGNIIEGGAASEASVERSEVPSS